MPAQAGIHLRLPHQNLDFRLRGNDSESESTPTHPIGSSGIAWRFAILKPPTSPLSP